MHQRFRSVAVVSVFIMSLLAVAAGTASAAPANDNFAGRQTLTGALPITVGANNIGATAEAGEPMVSGNAAKKTVWFNWTAPAEGDRVVDLCNAGFTGNDHPFIGIAIRTGNTLATLVLVVDTAGRCSLRFHSNAAVTYNFQIDYRDFEGTFNFTLRNLAPPVNDNFASATAIGPALPISQNGTTVDSTWQTGEPASLGGASQSRSVWYSWTAPASERIRVSLCEKTLVDGPLNDRTIVYTGSTLATLVVVADLTSNDCNMDFPVVAGTTYRIAVSGHLIGDFNFILELKQAPPPANDNFAAAQVIGPGLPVNATGDNDFATEETGEPTHGGYPDTSRSVWFSWTAPESGPMRIKTCAPDLTLFTSVYTGTLLTALTDVSTRKDWAPCSRYFDAVAGTTYRIAVAGAPFGGTHGPFSLEIHRVVLPANDSFDSAVDLGSPVTTSVDGTTVDATWETNEPSHSESYGEYGGSVWYRWTAPNDSATVLSACSSVLPNRITVFAEDPEIESPELLDRLRIVDTDFKACRDGSLGGRLAIAPTAGATYFISVTSSLRDLESPFTLKVDGIEPVTPVTPKPAGFNLKKAIAKCKKIKGKSAKAKRKRANCIKAAKKKAALIKCAKIKNTQARAKCVKKVRKRFK